MHTVSQRMAIRAAGEYSDVMSSAAGTLLMAPSSGLRKFEANSHSSALMPMFRLMRMGTRSAGGRRDEGAGACD